MVLVIEPIATCALGKCSARELQPNLNMQMCTRVLLHTAPESTADCSHPLPHRHTVKHTGQEGTMTRTPSHSCFLSALRFCPAQSVAKPLLHVSLPEGYLPPPLLFPLLSRASSSLELQAS